MTFYVENETEVSFPFDLEAVVEEVAQAVLEGEKCPYEAQLNVLVTDNHGIREYNREHRGMDKETDVLSFPNLVFALQGVFEDIHEEDEADYFDPETGELILGDIIISADKVIEQAQTYGHSLKREFAFLVAHSMYHLCGYDHVEEADAACMESKQEELLNMLGITRD